MSLKRIICLLLSIALTFGIVAGAVSCGGTENPPENPPEEPTEDETVYIVKDDKTDYSITYSDVGVRHSDKASKLWSKIMVDCLTTGEMSKYKYTEKNNQFEILIGNTDRQISKDLVAAVTSAASSGDAFAWGYGYKDGKLAYYANSDAALNYSWDSFVNLIIDVQEKTVSVDSDLWVIGSKSIAEYEEEISNVVSGEWKTDNLFDNPQIEASVKHSYNSSTVTLKNDHYSLARMVSTFGTVKSNYYYQIKLDYELDSAYASTADTDVRILEIWYNGNSELRRQYVKSGEPSLAPENANKLVIEVLVRGHDTDNVQVSLPRVREIGPYEKREVKLAAFTLKYGNVNGRPRTCQDNLDQSLAKIDELCADPNNKPDLIVFTEIFYTLGVAPEHLYDGGYLKLDSPQIKAIQAKAKQYGVYISFSFSEVDENGYYYNSAPLIDRNGEIVLNYHKAHLTMKEYSKGVMPGNEIMVYDTDFGRVGMAICWDLFFNEYVNLIKGAGAELIINPSLGYQDDINSIRAEDTGTYILTAGQGYSGTAIVAPEGEILDKGDWGNEDGIVTATVDLAKVYPVKWLSAASTAERDNVYHYEANDKLINDYYKKPAEKVDTAVSDTTGYTKSGAWYTKNLFDNERIEAGISHLSGYTVINTKNGYSLGRILSDFTTVKGNYYYDISVKTENSADTTDIRLLEIWYDASDRELQRQYVERGTPSLAPANAAKLVVEVLVRGYDADTVKIYTPMVKEVGVYAKREVKVAAFCLKYTTPRTCEDNLNDTLAKIDQICADPSTRPDLVVFTETFYALGGVKLDSPADAFLKLDSPEIKKIQAKAKQYGVYISFSFSEVDDEGNYYNSAPLIDRNGEIVLNYHKAQITMKEFAKGVDPGNQVVVYDTDFGRVGIAICWDLFFNDYVNLVKDAGAEIIINPSLGWNDDINSMRSEDTGAYIVTAGQGYSGTGITAPEGTILDRGDWGNKDGIVTATIDLAKVYPVPMLSAASSAERDNVYKYEARPDLYEKYRYLYSNENVK